MKHTLYRLGITTALLLCALRMNAQEIQQHPISVYYGQIKVIPYELEQREGELFIRLQVDSRKRSLSGREAVLLTPVLLAPNNSLCLPPMRLNGHNEQIAYERDLLLNGRRDYAFPEIVVRSGERIDYREQIHYKPWMKDARLSVIVERCGCNRQWDRMGLNPLMDSLTLKYMIDGYHMDLEYSYILPQQKPRVETPEKQEQIDLQFPLNSSELDLDFANNRREVSRLLDALKQADANDRLKIRIYGYASPDGDSEQNRQLAQSRAEALQSCLMAHSRLTDSHFTIVSKGEDWAGLNELLQNVSVAGRDEVERVLNIPDVGQRKAMLQQIEGGRTYRQLRDRLFPQLRRVTYKIDCNSESASVPAFSEMIHVTPVKLSQAQMTELAMQYPVGSPSFNAALESIARLYDRDPAANLNAASAALSRGDLTLGAYYLQWADSSTPEYVHCQGIIELLQGNFARARKLIAKAAKAGLSEAAHNLDELTTKEQSVMEMKNRLKYN